MDYNYMPVETLPGESCPYSFEEMIDIREMRRMDLEFKLLRTVSRDFTEVQFSRSKRKIEKLTKEVNQNHL